MEGDERKAEKGDGEGERSPILYEEADKRKQNNSQGKGGLDEEHRLKFQTISLQNLHGGSDDSSHGPPHEFVGKDKHGQDVAGAEEPCHELSRDINLEGPS